MVTCQFCKKQFKRINIFHLKTHNIKDENEYLRLYPSAKLYCDEYLKNISNYTKMAMDTDIVKSKLKYKKTKQHMNKIANSIANLHKEGIYSNIYTKERNNKISIARKEYWKTNDTSIVKKWLSGWVGSDKHIQMCKSNQLKASKQSLKNKISKPEKEYAIKLKKDGIVFKQQYFLNGYFFDFYIPEQNLLIEIDGEFYHPLNEKDCVYKMQKDNFERDIKKTKVAIDMGYKLKRIRV
jgi:very-short-patch-repair endonuclease